MLGIVSDTHSNLSAFQAVLDDMGKLENITKKIHLGDIVGYACNPNECMELAVNNFNYICLGNHDLASIDLEHSWGFNPMAKEAVEWTNKRLKEEHKELIGNLRYGHVTEDKLMFVHGSPSSPFGYIVNEVDASRAFSDKAEDFDVAFVGHTHMPMIWIEGDNGIEHIKPKGELFEYKLPNKRCIVNVGSVGQPRDGDHRACYVTYSEETRIVSFRRVEYSIDRTVAKMQREQFDSKSWMRLLYGK
jgi:diadenosine tetraphosphatase ApaH/serine/threonine PP2A family protein phosphatase